MKVPNWVKTLWNKYFSKIQEIYDKIDTWDAPKWFKDLSEKLWPKLPSDMRKKFYDFAMVICKKFDADYARELLEILWKKIMAKFK